MTLHLEEEIIRHARENPQQLPTLDMILDRFAIALPLAFKSFLSILPEIEEKSRQDMRCDVAVETLPQPCLISVVKAHPWAGRVACVVEPDLLFSVLELMLGGSKGKPGDWKPRSFTAIERSIGMKVAELVLNVVQNCFGHVLETTFEHDLVETMPKALVLAQPGTPSFLARYAIDLDGRRGHVSLLIPYGSFGEVRGILAAPFHGGLEEGPGGWDSEMGQTIADAELKLTAVLTHIRVSLSEVLAWQKGQVIDLGVTPEEPITGTVNGTPALRGAFGHRANGSLALRVTERLVTSEEALKHVSRTD